MGAIFSASTGESTASFGASGSNSVFERQRRNRALQRNLVDNGFGVCRMVRLEDPADDGEHPWPLKGIAKRSAEPRRLQERNIEAVNRDIWEQNEQFATSIQNRMVDF
jgi:hypothetical protein